MCLPLDFSHLRDTPEVRISPHAYESIPYSSHAPPQVWTGLHHHQCFITTHSERSLSIVHLPSAPPRTKPVTHNVYVYVREAKDTDHGVYAKCARSHCSCFEASAEAIKEKKRGGKHFLCHSDSVLMPTSWLFGTGSVPEKPQEPQLKLSNYI